MKQTLLVIREYFRLAVLGELEYRANFFIQLFESVIGMLVGLGGLFIVFQHTETLGDWLPDQLLALIGIYLLIGGLINFVISPSMERFMQEVRLGTLDFTLTKPADAQLLISVRQFAVWKLVDVGLGILVLMVALVRLQAAIRWQETAVFLLTLLCGTIIIYCFWIILATLSFWFVKVENILVIFQSTFIAARWPITIYPSWLQFGLTFIVPVAFAVTVPAQGLVGKMEPSLLLTTILLTMATAVAARIIWKIGLSHYSGASA